MRISDWSSDVCSSDLRDIWSLTALTAGLTTLGCQRQLNWRSCPSTELSRSAHPGGRGLLTKVWPPSQKRDRKSIVNGKSVSVRVDTVGRRIIKQKRKQLITHTHKKIKK